MAGFGTKLLRSIGLASTPETTRLEKVSAGSVVLRGKLRSRTGLRSPLEDVRCVGYVYWSTQRVPVPQGGFRRLPLVKVKVYAEDLELELEGGRVSLRPKQVDSFSREQHERLAEQGYEDFKAKETRLIGGREAILRGKASREGDRWVVVFKEIELPPKPPAADKASAS